MKVKTGFFCIQEKKNYVSGDEYTGKRKDLKGFLEISEPVKSEKQPLPEPPKTRTIRGTKK